MEKVAELKNLEEGKVIGVQIGAVPIAIFRLGNEVYATDNLCTHEYCVISENYLLHGEEVECTCHGSHFNIKTGQNTVPPAAENLQTYKTQIVNGEVFVDI